MGQRWGEMQMEVSRFQESLSLSVRIPVLAGDSLGDQPDIQT